MPSPFRTTRLVEFADTDMAGIVHFASFFRYMEAAEHALLRHLGFSVILDLEGERISFPRVSASCDYFQPARFEEVLDISVTVDRLGGSSITYGFEFTREGTVLARGRLTTVCCQVSADHALASRAIPEPIRTQLGQFQI